MTLRRVDLPIVSACPAELELQPDPQGASWCERCAKPVHVLTGLREHEVRTLLAAHAGRSLCVEYRARRDGTIALRLDAARPLLATAIAGLAACASPSAAPSTPPADAVATEDAAGCPLPRTPDTSAPTQPSGEHVMTANFRIDPDAQLMRGVIVLDGRSDNHRPDRSDRLAWIPTKKLWKDFVARVRARRVRGGG